MDVRAEKATLAQLMGATDALDVSSVDAIGATASTSGGRSLVSTSCAGAITVSQWQIFSS